MIAACAVDGGTRVRREFDADRLRPMVADMLRAAQRPRTRDEERAERARGGRLVELPVPQLSPLGQVVARVEGVGGDRRQQLRMHIPYVAHISINLEQGTMTVEAKAPALWSWGWRVWCERIVSMLSWWCGEEPGSLEDLVGQGWEVVGLELCSDFVGVEIFHEDRHRFLTPPRMKMGTHWKDYGDGEHGEPETIELGRRTSNVSWCIYRKTEQIEAAKDGDGSVYWSQWRDGGWCGENVVRVEIRCYKRGLRFTDKDTGELYDFRDPAALDNGELLAMLWRAQTSSVRIIDPTSSTRRKRCNTDPRWAVVQSASDAAPVRMRQDREVQKDAHAEAKRLQRRQLFRLLMRHGAMHGVMPSDWPGLVELFRGVMGEAIDEAEDPAVWLRELQESAQKYAAERAPYMGREIWEDSDPIRRRWNTQHLELLRRPPPPEDMWWDTG